MEAIFNELLFVFIVGNRFKMALKNVKKSLDRIFDKNLQDLVRGIRNHKDTEVRTTSGSKHRLFKLQSCQNYIEMPFSSTFFFFCCVCLGANEPLFSA